MKDDQKVLQTAVQPVPSIREMTTRFATVLIVVWLDLRFFEEVFRWLGYCLLDTNDKCEHVTANNGIWLTLAIMGAVVSIWKMLQARSTQAAARRQLAVLQMTAMRRIGDVLKQVISGIVMVFLIVLILAVAAFLFVLWYLL